jgi:hypothetical protein
MTYVPVGRQKTPRFVKLVQITSIRRILFYFLDAAALTGFGFRKT